MLDDEKNFEDTGQERKRESLDEYRIDKVAIDQPSIDELENVDQEIQQQMQSILDMLAKPEFSVASLRADVRILRRAETKGSAITVSMDIAEHEVKFSDKKNEFRKYENKAIIEKTIHHRTKRIFEEFSPELLDTRLSTLEKELPVALETKREAKQDLLTPEALLATAREMKKRVQFIRDNADKETADKISDDADKIENFVGEAVNLVNFQDSVSQEGLAAAQARLGLAGQLCSDPVNGVQIAELENILRNPFLEEYRDDNNERATFKEIKEIFAEDNTPEKYTKKKAGPQKIPDKVENFCKAISKLESLLRKKFTLKAAEALRISGKNADGEQLVMGADELVPALTSVFPPTSKAFSAATLEALKHILEILEKACANKSLSLVKNFMGSVAIHRDEIAKLNGSGPKIFLQGLITYIAVPLTYAGLFLITTFGIFASSIGFGLAQPGMFLMKSAALSNPLFAIALAAIGVAFIMQLIIRKFKFSTADTPLYKAIASTDDVLTLLDDKAARNKPLFKSALLKYIDTAIEALDPRYAFNDNLAHLVRYKESTTDDALKKHIQSDLLKLNQAKTAILGEESLDAEHAELLVKRGFQKETIARLREKNLNKGNIQRLSDKNFKEEEINEFRNKDLSEKDINALREIFENLKKTEIDPTHKSPYSLNRNIDIAVKISLSILSISSMAFCTYTLFSIFTGAAWIGGIAGIVWSMSLAAGLGFLSWVTARSVLNHTATGPFGEFAAIFAPFAIATIFILKAGSVAALGSWFAAFAIPALLFILAVMAAIAYNIFYDRKDKSGKRNIRNSAAYQFGTTSLLALKISLIIGFMLLAFLSMATILNLYGLNSFGGIDHVVGFAFDRIAEALGYGGLEVGMQWLSAFSIGIFATASFAAFMLLKDVLQISPTSANDKGILTRLIARMLSIHIDKAEKIAKSIAQIIKLGFTVGMIAGFWGLAARSGTFVAGASTELFLPFLIVAIVMPLLSGNTNIAFLPKSVNNFCNTLFGITPFHGPNGTRNSLLKELLWVWPILLAAPIIFGYSGATPISIILGVGAGVTILFRTQRIISDRRDPTVLVKHLEYYTGVNKSPFEVFDAYDPKYEELQSDGLDEAKGILDDNNYAVTDSYRSELRSKLAEKELEELYDGAVRFRTEQKRFSISSLSGEPKVEQQESEELLDEKTIEESKRLNLIVAKNSSLNVDNAHDARYDDAAREVSQVSEAVGEITVNEAKSEQPIPTKLRVITPINVLEGDEPLTPREESVSSDASELEDSYISDDEPDKEMLKGGYLQEEKNDYAQIYPSPSQPSSVSRIVQTFSKSEEERQVDAIFAGIDPIEAPELDKNDKKPESKETEQPKKKFVAKVPSVSNAPASTFNYSTPFHYQPVIGPTKKKDVSKDVSTVVVVAAPLLSINNTS